MMEAQTQTKNETLFAPLNDIQSRNYDKAATKIDQAFLDEVALAIRPKMYWYVVMPIGMARKIGSIILPDRAADHQKWTHGLGVVVCHGPGVYRGKSFTDAGISPDEAPQPGDLCVYDPKTPKKFKFDNIELVQVPDVALINQVSPDYAHRISWDFGF